MNKLTLSLFKKLSDVDMNRTVQDVTCEKCQTAFHYKTPVEISGRYVRQWFDEHQKNRKIADMMRTFSDIQKLLTRDARLVPCPKCHWVNEELIARYKHCNMGLKPAVYGLMLLLGLAALNLTSLWATLLGNWLGAFHPLKFVIIMVWIFLTFPSVLLLMFSVYFWLERMRIKPNINWPKGPPVIPAITPPALKPAGEDEQGKMIYEEYPANAST